MITSALSIVVLLFLLGVVALVAATYTTIAWGAARLGGARGLARVWGASSLALGALGAAAADVVHPAFEGSTAPAWGAGAWLAAWLPASAAAGAGLLGATLLAAWGARRGAPRPGADGVLAGIAATVASVVGLVAAVGMLPRGTP